MNTGVSRHLLLPRWRRRLFQRSGGVMAAGTNAVNVTRGRPLDSGTCHNRPYEAPWEKAKTLGAVVVDHCISTRCLNIFHDSRKKVIDTSVAAFPILESFDRRVRKFGWRRASKEADPVFMGLLFVCGHSYLCATESLISMPVC